METRTHSTGKETVGREIHAYSTVTFTQASVEEQRWAGGWRLCGWEGGRTEDECKGGHHMDDLLMEREIVPSVVSIDLLLPYSRHQHACARKMAHGSHHGGG